MASNPLLALLNFSGAAANSPPIPDSNSNVVNGNNSPQQTSQQNSLLGNILGSSSPAVSPPIDNSSTASANAANSLLQSLLRPSPQNISSATPSHASQSDVAVEQARISSPAAKDGAAELLALLGGGGGTIGIESGTPVNSSTPIEAEQSKASSLNEPNQAIPQRAPSRTIFDQVSPFDILNSPPAKPTSNIQTYEAARTISGQIKTESPSIDSMAQRTVSRTSDKSNLSKENMIFTNSPQLRAINQLASLRNSQTLDVESSSGLTIRNLDGSRKENSLDLSSKQPAGKSSLYPAKLELTAISILKGPREPPSILSDASTKHIRGRWPLQNILAGANDILCYITGKSKVRIIDEKTGERAMVYAEGAIRSIFMNDDTASDRTAFLLGVMTEHSVSIWTLSEEFGKDEGGVKLVAKLGAEAGSTFLHASFVRGKKSNMESTNKYSIFHVQSDGRSTIIHLADLYSSEKATRQKQLSGKKAGGKNLVGYAQSHDGSLVALVHTIADSKRTLEIDLRSVNEGEKGEQIRLSGLPDDVKLQEVSFAALTSDGQSTRSLLLGFNRNTLLAFVDLTTGDCRQIYRFEGQENVQFNAVQWSHERRALFIFNSLRSSLFTLKPFQDLKSLPTIKAKVEQGEVIDDSSKTLDRIRTKEPALWAFDDVSPVMRECALPEVWMSFYIDDLYEWDGVRIAALYTGGIQSIVLPAEAMRQTVDHSQMSGLQEAVEVKQDVLDNVASSNVERSETQDVKNKAISRTNSHLDIESLRDTLSMLEKNILSSISATSARSAAESVVSSNLTAAPSSSEYNSNADQLSETIVNRLLPRFTEQINASINKEVGQTVTQVINKSLPNELQNALLRPDMNAHLTRTITNSIVPAVQRTAMDVVTRAIAPHFEEVIGDLTSKVEAKVEQGMVNVRKDIVVEQSKALLGSEAAIRDLTRQMGQLTSMMEGLSRQNAKLERALNDVREEQKVLSLNSIRPSTTSGHQTQASRSTTQQPTTVSNGSYTHSNTPSGTGQPRESLTNTSLQPESVEDSLLAALSLPTIDQDPTPVLTILTNLEQIHGNAYCAIRSPQGTKMTSQAVNLALLHKLIKVLLPRNEPEKIVPWIEACCSVFDRNDPQINRFFEGVRREMVEGVLQAHHRYYQATNQTPWWTPDRLNRGILHFIS